MAKMCILGEHPVCRLFAGAGALFVSLFVSLYFASCPGRSVGPILTRGLKAHFQPRKCLLGHEDGK